MIFAAWRGRSVILLSVAALLSTGSPPARADDPDNCLFCHQYRGLGIYDAQDDRVRPFYVAPDYVHARLGPHARLACTDCHERSEVSVVPHRPTSKVDCSRACHLQSPTGLERRFSHANVAEMLTLSVHAPDVLSRTESSHGELLQPNQSACLYCHDEPVFRDPAGAIPMLEKLGSRTFDRCDTCHRDQIHADIAYYLRHVASRLQHARPPLELAQVCAVCHSDPHVLDRTGLHDAVGSFTRSFHGKAALLGDESTANCLSCHVAPGENAHLMLSAADPRSSVHPNNVPNTCRTTACHPGADPAIGVAAVHVNLQAARGTVEFALAAAFILLTILTFGPSMLIVVMELLALVIGRVHKVEHETHKLAEDLLEKRAGRRLLHRFSVTQRVQHWVLVLLFTLLALTGFPMKFADQAWSRVVIDLFGGLEMARNVHHWAGVSLVLGFIFHVIYIVRSVFKRLGVAADGRRSTLFEAVTSLPMWIGPQDLLKMRDLMSYLFFLRTHPPTFGRFSVKEKFEYVGVFWGTTLLGITGAMLWGEQLATHLVSGRVLNLALIAHTYEAFLAIIHVGILHIINVVLSPNVFPLSPAMLTGRTPTKELVESHSEFVREAAEKLEAQRGQGGDA